MDRSAHVLAHFSPVILGYLFVASDLGKLLYCRAVIYGNCYIFLLDILKTQQLHGRTWENRSEERRVGKECRP